MSAPTSPGRHLAVAWAASAGLTFGMGAADVFPIWSFGWGSFAALMSVRNVGEMVLDEMRDRDRREVQRRIDAERGSRR